jgi:hypothetical protein
MVRLILTHPKLWRAASDDHSGDPAAYQPPDDRSIHYVLAFSDALDLMGLFVFHPQSPECFAAHVALLPSSTLISVYSFVMPRSTCPISRPPRKNDAGLVP